MVTSLRSKCAVGKARGGRISESIRNRRATRPPAHFQHNPPGRCQLAAFPRCSLEWRKRNRKNVEPIKKIASKRARGDGALQVTVGGCNHSHVSANTLSSTNTFELALLQN